MLLSALWLLIAAAGAWSFLGAGRGRFGVAPARPWYRRSAGDLGGGAAGRPCCGIVRSAASARGPGRTRSGEASVGNASNNANTAPQSDLTFASVRSSTELDQAVKTAAQPAMLDFYADWCVSCKEMEKFTFSDPRVQAKLKQMNLLRADVTANNADDQTLLKRFSLFGPPGIIFFDQGGKEVLRVVGYESADKFLRTLDRANAPGA